MTSLKLYNTLTRKKEEFKPIGKIVGLYTCGPTVYNYAHIGNLRTYLFEDFLRRTLEYNGFAIEHVMNITDVGHLTGDMDMGEDKLEMEAKRENKNAWQLAEFYTNAFKADTEKLNILPPDIYCKATDHIAEQVEQIKQLETKGYTYRTTDGIYFDSSKFSNYNKLSHLPLEQLQEGARVEKNEEKKNATDFALWKFSVEGEQRQMEWPSSWGVGFPGWHIECSAMSLKYLAGKLDIHCGGVDHINIHHTNEIAQAESATGKKFFNYWLHGAFLNIAGGKKMAKSDDNFLTLSKAIIEKGLNPLVYRFAALQTHYRKPMEYKPEALAAAARGLQHLYNQVRQLGTETNEVIPNFKMQFLATINDDLNMPKAMAVVQDVLKSDAILPDKLATIYDFDRVLGLRLDLANDIDQVPAEIILLKEERERARANKEWQRADELRKKIEGQGFILEDSSEGSRVRRAE